MYHVELRQFPHNLCRFNLTAAELQAIAEPWARGQWVELGERRWSPHQAKLTVLEGEHLPPQLLTMGRGWRAAQREGEDVTTRVLAAAREASAHGDEAVHTREGLPAGEASATSRQGPREEERLAADSLGLELLSRLGTGAPLALSQAWSLAAARRPERPASEALALAEAAARSLLRARLIVLARETDVVGTLPPGDVPPSAKGAPPDAKDKLEAALRILAEHEIEPALRAPESWSGKGSARMLIRRA